MKMQKEAILSKYVQHETLITYCYCFLELAIVNCMFKNFSLIS